MAKIENIKELRGFVKGLGKFTVKRGRKTLYGLINTDGEIVLEPQPREIGIYDEKTVLLSDKDRKVWSGMTTLYIGISWLDRYADGWTKLAVPKEGIGG